MAEPAKQEQSRRLDEPLSRPPVVTPGSILRAARLEKGLETADIAHALNWLPEYVVLIEEDRHNELRSPSFGRGYVKAYAKLVDISQPRILRALDEWEEALQELGEVGGVRRSRKPPQLHRPGMGVFPGLQY